MCCYGAGLCANANDGCLTCTGFAHVQHAEEAAAYARCPERNSLTCGGLALSDVLRALMG